MRCAVFSLIIISSVCACASAPAADINAVSAVTEVTVFTDSAMLTRTADVALTPGEHMIAFSDIIPELDENSLKVTVSDPEALKIFGASVKREYPEESPSDKVKNLEKAIETVKDDMAAEQDLKNSVLDEKKFLDSISLYSKDQMPKELVTKLPSGQELDGILSFLGPKLRENYKQSRESEQRRRELNRKLQSLERELDELRGSGQKVKRSVTIEAFAAKAGTVKLKVSYLVYGAWWEPLYEARASFAKGQTEFVSYGIVKQTTGEDWNNVDISLSTSKPAMGGNMPEVQPWFIRVRKPVVMYDNRVMKRSANLMVAAEMAMPSKAESETDYAGAAAPVYAAPEEKGVSVLYKIPKKAYIKSDGSEHKLPVSSQLLDGKFEYSTYPRAADIAYLKMRVTNSKALQLLAGRVNIFFEGDFVGTSYLKMTAPGEEFDLYLGADENVKVKRELVHKKIDDIMLGGIAAPNIVTTFKYKLTLENYKSRDIKLNLYEPMPVSEDDKIKVKLSEISQEPSARDWKDKKGVWLWQLALKPSEKKEITYTVTVDHPRAVEVEGL